MHTHEHDANWLLDSSWKNSTSFDCTIPKFSLHKPINVDVGYWAAFQFTWHCNHIIRFISSFFHSFVFIMHLIWKWSEFKKALIVVANNPQKCGMQIAHWIYWNLCTMNRIIKIEQSMHLRYHLFIQSWNTIKKTRFGVKPQTGFIFLLVKQFLNFEIEWSSASATTAEKT